MLKRNPVKTYQTDMFRERLESITNMSRNLVKLASIIKWDWLETSVLHHYFHDNGRPRWVCQTDDGSVDFEPKLNSQK